MKKLNNIKRYLREGRYKSLKPCVLSLLFALFSVQCALALDFQAGKKKNSYIDVTVNNMAVEGNQLLADMTFDLSHVNLKGNAELIVTPMLVDENNPANFVELESFTIAGRNRFYWLERNNKVPDMLFKGWGSKKGEYVGSTPLSSGGKFGSRGAYSMVYTTPFQPWMNHARFELQTVDIGCANCGKGGNDYPLAETSYVEQTYDAVNFIYVTPVAEAVKMREISARAYIDFVVNRTEINPNYRRNPVELAKIRATIDSVRNDKDITVKKLHISGTASPEGSYQNNVRLAKGRTESLKDYVQNLYRFPAGVLTTSFEPVDWEGLRAFLKQVLGMSDETTANDAVRQDQLNNVSGTTDSGMVTVLAGRSALPHAAEILNIVNSSVEPYQRNTNIRVNYPKEYAWLLANVYPALRHSDYRIEFEIKTYSEVSEIINVMQTQPNKLSLAELFVAANSQPEGSDLYNRAFELAVMMYPQDETANLNAGIAAMKRNDYATAEKYLAKAGMSPEADYARAVFNFLNEDYETARLQFSNLVNSPNTQVASRSQAILVNMEEVDNSNGFRWRLLN